MALIPCKIDIVNVFGRKEKQRENNKKMKKNFVMNYSLCNRVNTMLVIYIQLNN